MSLINRDKVLKTIPSEEMVARMAVMSAPVVDAIPIEWIEKHMLEIEDDYVAGAFEGLIEIWRAEQEEQHETIV